MGCNEMDPPLCGLTFISHNGSRRPTQPCRHRRGRPGNQRCGSSASLAQSLAGRASAWPPAASAFDVSAGPEARGGRVGRQGRGGSSGWPRAAGRLRGRGPRRPRLPAGPWRAPPSVHPSVQTTTKALRAADASAEAGPRPRWRLGPSNNGAPHARHAVLRGRARPSSPPDGGAGPRLAAWCPPGATPVAPPGRRRVPRRQALLSPRWAAGQQGEAAGVEDAEHLQARARPPPERYRLVTRPGSAPLPAPARRAAGGARGGVTPGQPWAAWCG